MKRCPVCGRLVGTYVVRNRKGKGTHRRFDLHEPRYGRGGDCDMSDEPTEPLRADPAAGAAPAPRGTP
jgi:hypothetical protein